MVKTLKKSKAIKMLALFLAMAISMCGLAVVASAVLYPYQVEAYFGPNVYHYGYSFPSGSDNRLTASCLVEPLDNTTVTTVYVSLQKYTDSGWTTVTTKSVPAIYTTSGQSPATVFNGYAIETNTSYRMGFYLGGGTLAHGYVNMGISTWAA